MKTAGLLGLCGAIVFITSNCVSFVCTQVVHTDILKVKIDPNFTDNTITTFSKLVILSHDKDEFTFTIGSGLAFFVIQVHTYMNTISLSDTDLFDNHTYVTGSNVGLLQTVDDDVNTFNFYLRNTLGNSNALIVVTTYGNEDPIPGGCNQTLNVDNGPNQLVSYNENLIQVDMLPAAIGAHFCEEADVKIEMYHLYTPDYTEMTYFAVLMKMLTVESIREHATKINKPLFNPTLRRFYSSYKGYGSVFAAIATYKNGSSVYVPTVSYGCNVQTENYYKDCSPMYIWYGLQPASLYVGALRLCNFVFRRDNNLLYNGYEIFHMASIVTFYILSLIYSSHVMLVIYILLALLVGIIIMFIVYIFDVDQYAKSLILGYLLTTSIMFMPYMNHSIFQYGYGGYGYGGYWGTFFAIIVLMCVIMHVAPNRWNIINELTAAMIFIISFDDLFGGTLFYSIINNFRLLTVKNYDLAFMDPPYQVVDWISPFLGVASLLLAKFWHWRRMQNNEEARPLLDEEDAISTASTSS